jgi:hypothetical protein
MTINGQITGRGCSAASIAKPVRYGTAVGACPEPTANPTNPSSHGRCRIGAIAHPLGSPCGRYGSRDTLCGPANAAAAAPITGVIAAVADEVSAAIASLFSGHGQQFQALSTQAAAFHTQFVQALTSAGSSYAAAEAANASPLLAVVQGAQSLAMLSPVKDLTGRAPGCGWPSHP